MVPLVLLIWDRSFINFIENCSTGRLFKFGRLFYFPNYDLLVNYSSRSSISIGNVTSYNGLLNKYVSVILLTTKVWTRCTSVVCTNSIVMFICIHIILWMGQWSYWSTIEDRSFFNSWGKCPSGQLLKKGRLLFHGKMVQLVFY